MRGLSSGEPLPGLRGPSAGVEGGWWLRTVLMDPSHSGLKTLHKDPI